MEKVMQTKTELETTIDAFLDQSRERYGNDSYAAGYFSSWIRQLGQEDPWLEARIIRQLTYSMEITK